MEFIDNKLRRYTTFSKRKTGIMKKAYELSTLTGTQVMLLVASETGHVYTFATKKLQPMITSDAGKQLIQTCLNSPDGSASIDGDGDLNSTMETGFHTSELSASTPTKQTGKPGKNGKTLNDAIARNGKVSPKNWSGGSQLPTMVPQSSAFGSMSGSGPGSVGSSVGPGGTDEDDDDSDDSSNEFSPATAMQLGEQEGGTSGILNDSGQGNILTSTAHQTAAAKMAAAAAAQMLFPAASLIPTSVTSSSAASAFGLFPGLTPGGTVMYQVPQGVVYAAPSAAVSLADSQQAAANLMFAGLTSATDGGSGTNSGQQFITIPMPLSLQQMVTAQQQAGNDNHTVTIQDSGRDSSGRPD